MPAATACAPVTWSVATARTARCANGSAIGWDRLREQAPLSEPVTLEEIRDSFGRIAGHDFGMTEMRWSSRFLSERRQARHYRKGRVFLAGDAAHVHSPLGGQGMNTGIGDAMNLGWKLGAAVAGSAPPWLLDSYETDRLPAPAWRRLDGRPPDARRRPHPSPQLCRVGE